LKTENVIPEAKPQKTVPGRKRTQLNFLIHLSYNQKQARIMAKDKERPKRKGKTDGVSK